MRRRRRSRELLSVSLFPFLAVLICTFGVLIILLVIVVKAADQHAIDSSIANRESHNGTVVELQNKLDTQILRVEGLRSMRSDLLRKLRLGKAQRAHLQAGIAEAASDFEALETESKLLDRQSEQLRTNPHEAEIATLERRLQEEQDLLDKQRKKAAVATPVKYSVVPYHGSGTRRRPIYIECREEELIIQPHGIRLRSDDFVEPIVANNPLDAALVAVREYFLKNNLVDQEGTPYPLLIVRPDGPAAYAMARHAMKNWDEEFGYELISAEKVLDYGTRDPQLEQQIIKAVDAAKKRQQQYVALQVLNGHKSGSTVYAKGGLHASRQFGGFVASDGRIKQTAGQQSPSSVTTHSATDIASSVGDSEDHSKRRPDNAISQLKSKVQSIAGERGEGWALPSKSQGATAYRRPVKVYVSETKIVMDADSRANRKISIPFESNSATAVENLVEAIWRRIDSWGVAGIGGYWKPELDIVVLPGGRRRYQQIDILLHQSGIDLKEHRQ